MEWRTSVTPNSLIVVLPPWRAPSSASICWKHKLSFVSSKSSMLGRCHCWSRSELFCFRPWMSCVNFSSTSSSNWLFGWLELTFPFAPFRGVPKFLLKAPSSFGFFAEWGEAKMFPRVFVASVRTRFIGVLWTAADMLIYLCERGWIAVPKQLGKGERCSLLECGRWCHNTKNHGYAPPREMCCEQCVADIISANSGSIQESCESISIPTFYHIFYNVTCIWLPFLSHIL